MKISGNHKTLLKHKLKLNIMNNQEITIEKILPSRKNKDYVGLVLRTEIAKQGGSGLSEFLGSDFTEKRVTVQSIKTSILEEKAIEAGMLLADAMEGEYAIQVDEYTDSEFQALDAAAQAGFQKKINPETKAELKKAGECIWRNTSLVNAAAFADKLVAHDRVVVAKEVKA